MKITKLKIKTMQKFVRGLFGLCFCFLRRLSFSSSSENHVYAHTLLGL